MLFHELGLCKEDISKLKLDKDGKPTHFTHIIRTDYKGECDRLLFIHEHILFIPVHLSNSRYVIVMDREGKLFTVPHSLIEEMEEKVDLNQVSCAM